MKQLKRQFDLQVICKEMLGETFCETNNGPKNKQVAYGSLASVALIWYQISNKFRLHTHTHTK